MGGVTDRRTDWQTNTAIIKNNKLHLMPPKKREKVQWEIFYDYYKLFSCSSVAASSVSLRPLSGREIFARWQSAKCLRWLVPLSSPSRPKICCVRRASKELTADWQYSYSHCTVDLSPRAITLSTDVKTLYQRCVDTGQLDEYAICNVLNARFTSLAVKRKYEIKRNKIYGRQFVRFVASSI